MFNTDSEHFDKIGRSVTGTIWTLPFRYVTLPLAVAATGFVKLSDIDFVTLSIGLSKGVMVGAFFMFAQLMLTEYLVFGWIKKILTRKKE